MNKQNFNYILPNRLDRGFFQFQEELESAALRVLRSGWYILGQEVSSFEMEFANYIGSKYCVGVANGLDALWLAFKILGIGKGDEVIVQGNTYIASVMGITINGAKPVFVEPDEYFNIDATKIEEKITCNTKAILVVHLYGQATNMVNIKKIATRYNLKIIEDCAQSHGAECRGQKTGTFGDIGCFSFYPSKNLGAFGDGGAIITDNKNIADEFKVYRNYGSEKRYYNKVVGANSRLDEIQAALLRVRLQHIKEIQEERLLIAERYNQELKCNKILLPKIQDDVTTVWHQYVIKTSYREELREYLDKHQIGTIIHYPIPPHLSEAYAYLGLQKNSLPITENYAAQILSLPMYNGMTQSEQDYIIDTINHF